MIIFGGCDDDRKTWFNDIYALDLNKFYWTKVKESNHKHNPQVLANYNLFEYKNDLYILGGTRGEEQMAGTRGTAPGR